MPSQRRTEITWRINSMYCNMYSENRINLCKGSQEMFISEFKQMLWEYLKKFTIYEFEPHFAEVAENLVVNRIVIASPFKSYQCVTDRGRTFNTWVEHKIERTNINFPDCQQKQQLKLKIICAILSLLLLLSNCRISQSTLQLLLYQKLL